MTIIRASQDGDLPQITAIYSHHVRSGTGSFEIDAPTLAEMSTRRADVLAKGLPYIVAEGHAGGVSDGQHAGKNQILGYAYCTWSSFARPTGFPLKTPFTSRQGFRAKAWGAPCWRSWLLRRRPWEYAS